MYIYPHSASLKGKQFGEEEPTSISVKKGLEERSEEQIKDSEGKDYSRVSDLGLHTLPHAKEVGPKT